MEDRMQQTMLEKLDRLEGKLDRLNAKMDQMELRLSHQIEQVAAALAEHLAGPETDRGAYMIREERSSYQAGAEIHLFATVDEMKDKDPNEEN